MYKRECGTCTKCCEGWLSSTIYGNPMHKGRPCFYLDICNSKCSIYQKRPQDPCRDYSCAWLTDENEVFPMWMKPNLSNVIVSQKGFQKDGKDFHYYEVIEAGKKIESEVLNWIIHWALGSGINIVYEVAGNKFIFGEPEFAESLSEMIGENVTKF